MMTIDERLAKIETKIADENFLENKGLGNEVGYYIFDYEAKDELIVREGVADLKKRINTTNRGFKIAEFDLYNIIIEFLKNEDILDNVFELEQEEGMDGVVKAVSLAMGCTNEDITTNYIASYIHERVVGRTVIVLTGIGKCFPILRSHNILNVLHQKINTVPVVLFFPGKFTGQDLQLFGTIKKQNYYRAFRLVED